MTTPDVTEPRARLTAWVLGVAGVTFLAGLLFGYDQGVISGALQLIDDDLGLTTLESEIITSWVTLGALAGALVAGAVAERLGRRWAAVAAGVLFTVGAVLEAAAPGAGVLTFGRVVTGLGVGFASVVAPLYAAEMAPKRFRGRFVSSYQLAITVGIFLAYLADDALTGEGRWRAMFALAVVPGVLLVIGFLIVPESARWLLKVGRRASRSHAHFSPTRPCSCSTSRLTSTRSRPRRWCGTCSAPPGTARSCSSRIGRRVSTWSTR
jgi:MFS family permease